MADVAGTIARHRRGGVPLARTVDRLRAGIDDLPACYENRLGALEDAWTTLEILNALANEAGTPPDAAATEAAMDGLMAILLDLEANDGTGPYHLDHYNPLAGEGATDRVAYNGKSIGCFPSLSAAIRAHAAVADALGFRDHPDGFRLRVIPLDHTFFREGFLLDPAGDIAIAGDSSGMVGNDDEVAEFGHLPEQYPTGSTLGDPADAIDPVPGAIWSLEHFKIGPDAHLDAELGYKLVGIYKTAAGAHAAIARLRDKPGFVHWPGGWRIMSGEPDDQVHWAEGFVLDDWSDDP